MALSENNPVMTMPVAPAYGGGYGGGFGGLGGFGGDGWWILLLLLCGFGGFGGFGGGSWPMMMGAGMMDGMALYPWLNNSQNINSGFRDQMLTSQITSVGDKVASGFGDVQTALCGGFAGVTAAVNGAANGLSQQLSANQMAALERSFADQTATTAAITGVQSQLAQCCCENRLAAADNKYTVATEACANRTAAAQNTRDIIDAQRSGTQAILDKLCALELDTVKTQLAQAQRENVGLQNQLNMANLAASQVAQTAELRQANAANLNNLVSELRSCPIPAQPVYGNQPIFTCGGGCGCNGVAA